LAVTGVLSVLPLDLVGALALICVVATMTALGIGADPVRLLARGFPVRPLAAALAIALVLVPLAAIVLARGFQLQSTALLGLVLMGISPGAPMALRKSRQSGADADFALVLQVSVAVLAVAAVPLWLFGLKLVFGRATDISLLLLARQVFLVQILPLACGLGLRRLAPDGARRLVRPLLALGGVLMLAVAVLLVVQFWPQMMALPIAAWGASAALTTTALVCASLFCGPSPARRMSAGVICALRNPGIALLIASANGVPSGVQIMIVTHVLITAVLLGGFLALLRRSEAYRSDAAASEL
jgi:bile acid:Na+ symporter, BASS family